GFALWLALSALWSESPGSAWEAANRTVLYASLASLAVTAVPGRREGRLVGAVLVGGVSAVAVATLVRLLANDQGLFVAGRLDGLAGARLRSSGISPAREALPRLERRTWQRRLRRYLRSRLGADRDSGGRRTRGLSVGPARQRPQSRRAGHAPAENAGARR